ncbi:UNVERIFIED_ORG: phosphotransferase [Roseateles sp. XES5]|nr:phosphotransferase [Roseateles sp. XES5]
MAGEKDEECLSGGNVAASVTRVGKTVRKPATVASPAIHAFLGHLRAAGVSEAPASLGVDAEGLHVYDYVPGTVAEHLPAMSESELCRLGGIVRRLHDAAETFQPPPDAVWNVAIAPDGEEIVCHHDLAPWNLVRDGARWVFIDWDGAGPGSRLWDLAYALRAFVPLEAGGDPQRDASRLRAMTDGYGLAGDARLRLAALLAPRAEAMATLLREGARTGAEPWARLHAEGHTDYWQAACDYIRAHDNVWRAALHP